MEVGTKMVVQVEDRFASHVCKSIGPRACCTSTAGLFRFWPFGHGNADLVLACSTFDHGLWETPEGLGDLIGNLLGFTIRGFDTCQDCLRKMFLRAILFGSQKSDLSKAREDSLGLALGLSQYLTDLNSFLSSLICSYAFPNWVLSTARVGWVCNFARWGSVIVLQRLSCFLVFSTSFDFGPANDGGKSLPPLPFALGCATAGETPARICIACWVAILADIPVGSKHALTDVWTVARADLEQAGSRSMTSERAL